MEKAIKAAAILLVMASCKKETPLTTKTEPVQTYVEAVSKEGVVVGTSITYYFKK